MITVPAFPLLGEPGTWDDLTLLAATIRLEAEGEPEDGQVAVGWVIRARAAAWAMPIRRVILGPDDRAYGDGKPFEPFSCWNDDYRIRAEARLAATDPAVAEACWRAAAGVLWRLMPNPVMGALYYLNPELTRKLRGGTLPSWAADPADARALNQGKVVAVIGRHAFLAA